MISIIVAVAKNGVIGCQNKLIWHISEDLKRFKALTTGHPVVMGRKTFESIGRILPNRTNIVVSRNKELKIEGTTVVDSLQKAIEVGRAADGGQEIFIIGGAEIYSQAIELCDKVYYTLVDESPTEGDAFFKALDPNIWQQVDRQDHQGFSFIDYRRV